MFDPLNASQQMDKLRSSVPKMNFKIFLPKDDNDHNIGNSSMLTKFEMIDTKNEELKGTFYT